MELDILVDALLAEELEAPPPAATACQATSHMISSPIGPALGAERGELAAVALGGRSRLYLGRVLTPEQILAMLDNEIGKILLRYKMRLGASAAISLGKEVLQMYGQLVSLWRPKVDQSSLVSDL